MPELLLTFPTQEAYDKFLEHTGGTEEDAQAWCLARAHEHVLQKELAIISPVHASELNDLRVQHVTEDQEKTDEVDGWFTVQPS